MRWVFACIVAVHGLIHLMGTAKAFGFADLPQLTQPISRGMGLVWLLAAVLTLVVTVALFVWPRGWWMTGAAALVLSQAVIFSSWSDAKAGTLANILLLAGVAYGWFTQGPTSFRAQFERDVRAGLAAVTPDQLGPTRRGQRGGRRATKNSYPWTWLHRSYMSISASSSAITARPTASPLQARLNPPRRAFIGS